MSLLVVVDVLREVGVCRRGYSLFLLLFPPIRPISIPGRFFTEIVFDDTRDNQRRADEQRQHKNDLKEEDDFFHFNYNHTLIKSINQAERGRAANSSARKKLKDRENDARGERDGESHFTPKFPDLDL